MTNQPSSEPYPVSPVSTSEGTSAGASWPYASIHNDNKETKMKCRHCADALPDCRCVRSLRAAEAFTDRPSWARGPLRPIWLGARRRAYAKAAVQRG